MRNNKRCLLFLLALLTAFSACQIDTGSALSENCGTAIPKFSSGDLKQDKDTYSPDTDISFSRYRSVCFNPDSIISTDVELKEKKLLTSEELYLMANILNTQEEFQYDIVRAPGLPEQSNRDSNKTAAIKVIDSENNISARIFFSEDNGFGKSIYFETAASQKTEAEKMLWFAVHLFGNIPVDAFAWHDENRGNYYSPHYQYMNGEIIYRSYYSSLPEENSVCHYSLSQSYSSINQIKDFYGNSVFVTIPQLQDYFLSKQLPAVSGYVEDLQLDSSGDFFTGTLFDDNGDSTPCKIINIRSDDTVGDIKKATMFFGSVSDDSFNIIFYSQR